MSLKYNQEGCLLHKVYELSLQDVEEEFVKGKSQRRQDIFDNYLEHISEIKDADCCLNHWIDGSFVTLKENPNDIDTFTEFDGIKVKELGVFDEIEDLIYNVPLRTNNHCHSFRVYKVPESWEKEYKEYLTIKSRTLYLLFPVDSKSKNLKGFVKLKKVN